MTELKQKICEYIKNEYDSEIEYLWAKYPECGIFRHNDNRKWFCLINKLEYLKLDIQKEGLVYILNVKIDDWLLKDSLLCERGFCPAYHMNKEKWISVLLDGSVCFDEISMLIDLSFSLTSSKFKKNKTEH